MTSERMQSAMAPVGGAIHREPRFAGDEWSVELLRGVAAIMVMYAHYHALAGIERNLLGFAFTGVDLFFVISGFVFAPYFFGKTLRWLPFFIRRFFRIYPLYFVALCLYALQRYSSGQGVDHFLSHLFFLHTIASKEIAFYFNPAFWSLPPEVEFYLALPILCAVFAGTGRVVGLAVLALGVHWALVTGMGLGETWKPVFEITLFHLPGLLVEFSLGAVAWRVVAAGPGPRLRLMLGAVGAVLWFALARIFQEGGDAAIDATWWLHGNLGVWAATAYALLLAAFVGLLVRPHAVLRAVAVRLGDLSFGVYLFHNLMPAVLEPLKGGLPGGLFALLCVVATLSLAWVMHRFYEGPLREMGRELAARQHAARA